jgi:hypothetical protein
MIAQDIFDSEDRVRQEYEQALREKQAAADQVFVIKGKLRRLLETLNVTPCLVADPPPLHAPVTILDDLTVLDRKLVVTACQELWRTRENVRACQKQLGSRLRGNQQTTIDIETYEELS